MKSSSRWKWGWVTIIQLSWVCFPIFPTHLFWFSAEHLNEILLQNNSTSMFLASQLTFIIIKIENKLMKFLFTYNLPRGFFLFFFNFYYFNLLILDIYIFYQNSGIRFYFFALFFSLNLKI